MIALKRYIKNKFEIDNIRIEELDEFLMIDIRNANTLFDYPSIAFDMSNKIIYGDLPVHYNKLDIALDNLKPYFDIIEIHNHNEIKHIHIEGTLFVDRIDMLYNILKIKR